MRLLKNQPIAREGALNFNGKWMMKKWDNLKQFIGKKVPIPDDHPSDEEGRYRFFDKDKDKNWGFGEIKQCPNGNKQLCADIYLEDDAPERAGYSIGYGFTEVMEPGDINNTQRFDGYQKLNVMDHIALTDAHREPTAVKFYTDSKDDDNNINKYSIGYDTYIIEKTPKKGVEIENKMSEQLEKSLMKIGELEKELELKNTGFDSDLKDKDETIVKLREQLKKEFDARKSKELIQGDSLRAEFAELEEIDKDALKNATLDQLKFAKIVGDAIRKLPRADDEEIEEIEGDSDLDKEYNYLMKEWDRKENKWKWM